MNIPARKLLPWLALAAIAVVTVSPIEWRPGDIFGVNNDRALAFAVLSGLFVYAYPQHWGRVAVAMIGISFGLELAQLLAQSRHARLEDALVKANGAVAGIALMLLAREIRQMFLPRRAAPAANPAPAQPWHAASGARVNAIFFSQSDGTLRLGFSDGKERIFAGIEEGDFVELINAPSQDAYFEEKLRHREERRAAA